MFCCRATSWDSGAWLIYVILCCVCVAGLIEAGFSLPSGLCVGKLLPDLDMWSAMYMSFCVCSRGGSPNLWWVGILLVCLVFLRVASL